MGFLKKFIFYGIGLQISYILLRKLSYKIFLRKSIYKPMINVKSKLIIEFFN